jgi:uncharacterized repeat protein (TIGR03806 family)
MRLFLSMLLLPIAMSLSAQETADVAQAKILDDVSPPKLSEFGFFNGSPDAPTDDLIAYSLATPLFSDYSEKQRFIYLPKGGAVSVGSGFGRITFPVGTAIIKSFGYPDASGKLKIIETRILLNRKSGWTALPYVWNANGSDADLRIGGTRTDVTFSKPDGSAQHISYAVPNKNQCKQCHSSNNQIRPIGPMLGNIRFNNRTDRQRLLANANFAGGNVTMPVWNDPAAGSLNDRANSYLYVNCGHCHSSGGSASNSGLFFDESDTNKTARGIGKHPVAAGRGSGGLEFVIAPGKPEQSILLYRLQNLDPGIAMPELGRATVHEEGAALLSQWIASMPEEQF